MGNLLNLSDFVNFNSLIIKMLDLLNFENLANPLLAVKLNSVPFHFISDEKEYEF